MRLNQKMNNWLLKGIFTYLDAYDVPWKDTTDKSSLDLDYHGNHSGDKHCSPLLEKLNPGEELDEYNADRVAHLLYDKYIANWQKLWTAITFDYNPLENYNKTSIIEQNLGARLDTDTQGQQENSQSIGQQQNSTSVGQQQNSINIGQQQNSTSIGQIEETNNNGQKVNSTQYGEQNSTQENELAAFNSSNYSDDRKTTTKDNTHTDTTTEGASIDTKTTSSHSDSETIGSRSDSETIGSRSDSETIGSRSDSETIGSRTDTHNQGEQDIKTEEHTTGNIGVTTSQQMLESEFELRLKYNFFEVVYKDIDKVLTLRVY